MIVRRNTKLLRLYALVFLLTSSALSFHFHEDIVSHDNANDCPVCVVGQHTAATAHHLNLALEKRFFTEGIYLDAAALALHALTRTTSQARAPPSV